MPQRVEGDAPSESEEHFISSVSERIIGTDYNLEAEVTDKIMLYRHTHNTPDSQVWSDDTSKRNIRLVFTQ